MIYNILCDIAHHGTVLLLLYGPFCIYLSIKTIYDNVDIIKDNVTGALSKPFDPYSLADKIKWVLEDKIRNMELSKNARLRAENLWSEKRVSELYVNFYKKILSNQ